MPMLRHRTTEPLEVEREISSFATLGADQPSSALEPATGEFRVSRPARERGTEPLEPMPDFSLSMPVDERSDVQPKREAEVLSMAEVVRRADAAQIAYLNTFGRRALARVTSVIVDELCGQRRVELGVHVMPEHLPAYAARAPISESMPRLRSGDTIGVRYDPRRPKIVAVDRNWVPTIVLGAALA